MKRKNLLALIVFLGVLAVIDLPRLMSSCPHFPPATACGDPTTNPYAVCYPHLGCTCAASGCHGGTPLTNTSSTLTIMIQDSAVYANTGLFDTLNASFKDTPGHTYYMAFLLSSNTGIYGFEMTALNDTNMAGSFIVTDPTHTFLQTSISNIQYISHHNASSFLNWEYKWVAPASCEPVTFYYTYNLSDTTWLDTVGVWGTGLPDSGTIHEGDVSIQCALSGINDISDKISNLEIFPNPTNNQFNLSFALKQSGQVSLNVYSSDGKVVQNLMQDERREQGLFNSSFDISNLAPGIYLAKLSVGGASVTKKITKL